MEHEREKTDRTDQIVQRQHTLLMSERDRKVFFSALVNPPEPNGKLRRAADNYRHSGGV